MNRKKLFLLWMILLVAFLPAIQVMAQSDISIDSRNVNTKYLSQLIIDEADSLRSKSKLTRWEVNDILMQQAQQQATSLLTPGRNPTPITKRLLSENIPFNDLKEMKIETYLIEPLNEFRPIPTYLYRNISYRQTAHNISLQWLASSARYIKSDTYKQVGVGITVDSLQNKIVVYCVLASGLPSSPTSEKIGTINGTSFEPSKKKSRTWFKKPTRMNRNLRVGKALLGSSQEFKGWLAVDRKKLKRTFRWYHFRSGLVQETIHSDDFKEEEKFLNVPSRTNQRDIINGAISQRITRRHLIRLSKTEKENLRIFGWKSPIKVWKRHIGFPMPVSTRDKSSANLLLLRKAKLCDILLFKQNPGRELTPPFPKLDHHLLGFKKLPDTIVKIKSDTNSYKLYYKRNSTLLAEEDESELLSMVPDFFKIAKIKVQSFASIEGHATANEKLFQERAANIQKFLQQNDMLTSDVEMELKTKENWEVMHQQLNKNKTALNAQTGQTEIRDYINLHVSDSVVETWLDQQRYSIVSFELKNYQTKIETAEEVLGAYNKLVSAGKFNSQTIPKMVALQKRYYALLVGTQQTNDNQLELPDSHKFPALRFQQAQFKYLYQDSDESDFHRQVEAIAVTEGVSGIVRNECMLHHQIFLANALFHEKSTSAKKEEWNCPLEKSATIYLAATKPHLHIFSKRPPAVEALELIPVLVSGLQKRKASKELTNQMLFYYYVMKAQLLLREQKYNYLSEVKGLSNFVWIHFVKGTKLWDKEAIDLALFFSLTFNHQHAIELLKPLLAREKPNPIAIMITISLKHDENKELETENALLQARRFLTKEQWLELVESGNYLPIGLLERIKLREAWQKESSNLD